MRFLAVFLIFSSLLFAQKKAALERPTGKTTDQPQSSPAAAITEKAERRMEIGFGLYGGLPYANSIVARERISLLGVNLRFGYTLPKLLANRLALAAQLDIQRFFAKTIPAWGFVPQAGLGFLLWQKQQHRIHVQATGGMALGTVDRKEPFRIGVAELSGRYGFVFSERFSLATSLRQQFYFDPEGFFTATLLAVGVNYAF